MKRSGLPRPQQQQDQRRLSRAPGALSDRKSSCLPNMATPGKARQEKDHRNLKDRSWQKDVLYRACLAMDRLGMQPLCNSSSKPGAIWTLKEIYNVLECFVAGVIDLGQVSSVGTLPATDSKQRAEQLYARVEFLGYPYALGRQVLNSPNTPHNWPLVLGLLDYLCDRLDQRSEANDRAREMLQQRTVCDVSLEDVLQALEGSYAFFLQHGKASDHIERLVEPGLLRRRREVARLEEETRASAEEARQWAERANPAQRLQQELQELRERTARTEQETERQRQRRTQLESELPHKEAELAAGKAQLERLRADCESLSERIRAQPISQAQVMSLRGDIKEMESYIGRLDETLASTEREIGVAETQLSADHDRLAQVCNQTNMRLAHLSLPQRAVPELSEAAQQANQAIEPALKRLLADMAEQIERAGHRREEARKRHAGLLDAVDTQQARLSTIKSMIAAEKTAQRRSEEAALQEVSAAVEAAASQLAACEASRDRQRDRLAQQQARQRDSAGRLALAETGFARGLTAATDAVQRVVAELARSQERRAAIGASLAGSVDRLEQLSRDYNRFLVGVVSRVVATGSTNLMGMLLPRLQALLDEHRRRQDRATGSSSRGALVLYQQLQCEDPTTLAEATGGDCRKPEEDAAMGDA